MKPSTRDIFRRHGLRLDKALHNWVYFVFYKPYVKTAFAITNLVGPHLRWLAPGRWVARSVFDRYHAKVLSASDAEKILSLDQDVFLPQNQSKSVIPYKHAYDVIFREPKLIAVMDCPCKAARKTACEPKSCCIAVGRDFAQLWLDHCAHNNARQITQAEALDIIRRLRASGHITQAFLRTATGGLTGVICNCCPECCVSLNATRHTAAVDPALSMSAASGYSVSRDAARCTACGHCVEVCPFGCMTREDGSMGYARDTCMGCGLCVEQCPENALSLFRDPDKCAPLDLDELMKDAVE